MKKVIVIILVILAVSTVSLAGEIKINWNSEGQADGYKVYQTLDSGNTWHEILDTNSTNATLTMPEHGLVLLRISAYNQNGETIRTSSGIWYNADWIPPEKPKNVGVK